MTKPENHTFYLIILLSFRSPDGAPDWTDHDMLLGGLLGSALFLPLFLRTIGRVKTVAAVSMVLFFGTVLTMVSDEEASTGIGKPIF